MPADTMRGLRSVFDGKDGFMTGHQILKVRRPKRKTPEWTRTQTGIQQILLKAFPKLKTDESQRQRAGRWARVIQLYFLSAKSYRETAEEMGEKTRTIEMLIRSIHRTVKGIPVNGISRKKVRAVIPTSNRDEDKGPIGEPRSQLTL